MVDLTAKQAYLNAPGNSWYMAQDGYRAQAELIRRLTVQLVESSEQASRAAKRLEKFTIWLIVLTIAVVVLTAVLVIIELTKHAA